MNRIQIIFLFIIAALALPLLSGEKKSRFHSDYELRFICSLNVEYNKIDLVPKFNSESSKDHITESFYQGAFNGNQELKINRCGTDESVFFDEPGPLKIADSSSLKKIQPVYLVPSRSPPKSS